MKEKKNIALIILIILVVFSMAGAVGIYLLKQKEVTTLNSRVTSLQDQIEQLQASILELETEEEEDVEEATDDLPVVFTAGDYTEEEKTTLMEKFIEPYFAYQEDIGTPVEAMIIEYPKEDDDFSDYIVSSVLKMSEEDGGGYGYHFRLFGSTEEEYDYWFPFSPVEAPELTEDFINDYPEVMEEFCESYDCEVLGIE